MADKKDQIVAYNLFGWPLYLRSSRGQIVFAVIFAANEENRKAGKLTKLRLALTQKKALKVSRDLAEAALANQTPKGKEAASVGSLFQSPSHSS
ncbi:UDP-N-acetylenolpyruvoylglucosamine reductase [Bradyrhizobium sp. AZCC 1610]|uniref:hypothetical protein n=1 Tax=Bradyrhizobium sp. AZCC 1610 TaxID=3117020 RepID=UPI002FF1387F